MPTRSAVLSPPRTNPFQAPQRARRAPRPVSPLLSGLCPLVTPLPPYLPPVRPPAPTSGGLASRLVEPWPGPAGLGGDSHDTE